MAKIKYNWFGHGTYSKFINEFQKVVEVRDKNFALFGLKYIENVPRFLLPAMEWRVIQKVNVIYGHLRMALKISKTKFDIALVTEFLNIPLVIVSPILLLKKHKLIFMINHNIQRESVSSIEQKSFKVLLYMGFRFIFFDDSVVVGKLYPHFSKRIMSEPFPLTLEAKTSNVVRDIPTISIIGDQRKEKHVNSLILELIRIRDNCEYKFNIQIGTNDAKFQEFCSMNDIVFIDTTKNENYVHAIELSDIVCFSYSKKDYFYRTSGVIQDVLSMGALVICPNFPVLEKQVVSPVQYGYTYDIENFHKSFSKAVNIALAGLNNWSHQEYIKYHATDVIVNRILNKTMDS